MGGFIKGSQEIIISPVENTDSGIYKSIGREIQRILGFQARINSLLQNVDVLVGKKFGPNLPRLLEKFVCVLVRTDAISNAIEAVHNNMDRIVEEMNKGEGRKHIVLGP